MLINTVCSVKNPIQEVFEYIIPIKLTHLFRRFKYFPAVSKTNETQKWITAGLTRTVSFEDGNTAQEELTIVHNPKYFAYRVTSFSSPLRFLINQINGSWEFEQNENVVNIVWKYELISNNKLSEWIIENFLQRDMKTFCQNAMNIIVADLELAYNLKK